MDASNHPEKQRVYKTLYDCPRDGCCRSFKTAASLDSHLTLGNCEYELDRLPLSDKAKVMYTEKVNTMRYDVKGIPVQSTSAYLPSQPRLSQGWALKQKKPKSAFTPAQKNI